MAFEILKREERDGWLEVAIDRPKALNALNAATLAELEELAGELESRSELRGLILTGGGDKAFVAGADITELTGLGPAEARAYAARGQALFTRIERGSKPVIAAIGGYALGGGCELALACHLRVLSSRAKLGLPEVGLGVIPGFGGTQRLARIVGLGRALEMILGGEMVDAETAFRLGLANRVVEPEQLLDTCREIAGSIGKRAPLAVSAALRAAVHGRDLPLEDGLALEAAEFALLAHTEDWKEGTGAFVEKRKPEFRGR